MSLSQEDLHAISELLGRRPSKVEEVVFDTMWSEHCSYKSSKPTLKTLPTKGSNVMLGVGEDSGIIFLTDHNGKRYGVAVSHESHNHPSQVLPIEGAATGVGGVVRDVYCMGADVFGVLDSLHFGLNKDGKTPLVEEIEQRVVKGVSDYGNALGVPVLGGETLYHTSYNDNCLVNVAALGLVSEDEIIHSYVPDEAKTEPYDVILFGKSTDSTGFGGASFSSDVLDEDDDMKNLGAVQVHDPFLKRVIVDAIRALLKLVKEKNVAIGFKDLGAGGISCATSELGVGAGLGVSLNLDAVNVAVKGLAPEVIACSETQERFCLVVPRWFSQDVLTLFNETYALPELYHQAGAAIVGEVTQDPNFVITHQGETVCYLPISAITTDVHADRTADNSQVIPEGQVLPNLSESDCKLYCLDQLKEKNNASKRYVYRFYDNAVRGDTVIYPGEADAVVVTPIDGCDVGVAVSMDSNLYGNTDPYVSGAYAVAEAVRNVIAVGAEPLALTDCLNYGSPEQPRAFFGFQEGVRGIGDAARSLSFIEGEPIPIISGNVSFYNESKSGNAVVPSPVICAIGRVNHYEQSKTMQCFEPGKVLIMLGKRFNEFGSTQLATMFPDAVSVESAAPQVRFDDELKHNKAVYDLFQKGWIHACHDISMGGLWQTLIEMMMGERGLSQIGLDVRLPDDASMITQLFSENGGYVIAVEPEHNEEAQAYLENALCDFQVVGQTISELTIQLSHDKNNWDFDLETLKSYWNKENQSRLGTPV